MTEKEKRKYLEEYQSLQRAIIGFTFEIEKWKSIGDKVNSAMDATGVRAGGNVSKVERSAVNTSDILRDIQNDINDCKKRRDGIKDAINQNSAKMRHRELLTMHFVNGMSVRQIAKLYSKEDKTVSNAISVAIRELNI